MRLHDLTAGETYALSGEQGALTRVTVLDADTLHDQSTPGAPAVPTARATALRTRSGRTIGVLAVVNPSDHDMSALHTSEALRRRLVHDMRTTGQAHTDDHAPVTIVSPTVLAAPWTPAAYERAAMIRDRRQAERAGCPISVLAPTPVGGRA